MNYPNSRSKSRRNPWTLESIKTYVKPSRSILWPMFRNLRSKPLIHANCSRINQHKILY